MLFPVSTPKKTRRNNKENEPPSPQESPFGRNAVGDDDGFTNESMSIIPSSMCLAATAMTTLAQRSAKAAAAEKARNKEVSVENPQPSTSKATAPEKAKNKEAKNKGVSVENPQPSTSRAADVEEPPMDPFAPVAGGSKHGKGTKGLKGKAKVGNLGISLWFPQCFTGPFFFRRVPWLQRTKVPPTRKPESNKRRWTSRKRCGNTTVFFVFQLTVTISCRTRTEMTTSCRRTWATAMMISKR